MLREALNQAEAQLVEHGLTDTEVQRLLEPAHRLLARADSWQSTDAKGLAVFLGDDGNDSPALKTLRLPYSVPQTVDISARFHVTPLIGMLDWNTPFHLLALSQNSVRLYACDRSGAELVALPAGVPSGFAEFTSGTEVGKPIQFRASAAAGAGGDQTPIVHGQTSYKDEHKARVREFVSEIGKGIHRWMEGRHSPLVLAAVEDYHPVFQNACPSAQLVSDGIYGSPDQFTEEALHESATQCVADWNAGRLADFNGRFKTSMAHGHASCEIESIVPAAFAGRVESLLVASGETIWGRCDRNAPLAVVSDERTSGDVDLLDLAVAETLAHGGEVHATDSEQMPAGSTAAALLRW
jgi:hypothetical protein